MHGSFRRARLFDANDPERGPVFAPDHPRIEDAEERERLYAFLDDGRPILRAAGATEDRVDPARGRRVPIVTLTDGHWIWNAGHAYYLREHRMALEPDFHEHIRQQNYTVEEVDQDLLEAALRFLREEQQKELEQKN